MKNTPRKFENKCDEDQQNTVEDSNTEKYLCCNENGDIYTLKIDSDSCFAAASQLREQDILFNGFKT